MRLRGLLPAALVTFYALVFATPSRPAPPSRWTPPPTLGAPPESGAAATAKRPVRWIDDVPDTGQFLPDTALLARVQDREIRVGEYIDAYFRSYAEYRPRPDSAGRIEFLNSMINKEVMALTALAINRPLGFEDRAKMREHTARVMSNVLYQRAVVDSSPVSEQEMRKVYEQYSYAQRLRHIQFADRATAVRVRADLVAGRIPWKDAVRKYSLAPDRDRDGDLGWRTRFGTDPAFAPVVWPLKPGEISPILQDPQGYLLIQAVERRPETPLPYEDLRASLRSEIQKVKIEQRTEALLRQISEKIGMVHDTANIEWAAAQFRPARKTGQDAGGPTLELNLDVPELSPADTGRVLARHRHGKFTLGSLIETYGAIPPLMRPNVDDFESMQSYVDGQVLEPYMAELADRRGLAQDPMAIRDIEKRREEILVEHLYQDSIMSKVWIKPEERRKYYQDHLAAFVTYPRVKFAAFVRNSRAAADSLAGRLRAGEKAEDLLRADSLRGQPTGSLQERSSSEEGTPYHKLLFEELRPGQVSVQGPDRAGEYAVIQLLSFDAGRQLPYEEAEHHIDHSLQNLQAEERLKAFLERHRKRYRIEARPELLRLVRLVDPTLLE